MDKKKQNNKRPARIEDLKRKKMNVRKWRQKEIK